MSQRPLPRYIEPLKLVEKKTILTGQLMLDELPRFLSCVIAQNPETGDVSTAREAISVQLDFFRDEEGLHVITGQITGQVDLECQRCLGLIKIQLEAAVALAIVANDQEAENLPGRYNALVLNKKPVSLINLVEDELLLALPTIAYHEEGQCSMLDYCETDKKSTSNEAKPGPFDVLADLKE